MCFKSRCGEGICKKGKNDVNGGKIYNKILMPLLMSTFQFLNPNINGPIRLALIDDDDDDDGSIVKVLISNEVILQWLLKNV